MKTAQTDAATQPVPKAIRVGKVPFGKGVFAARDIAAGEVLGQALGKVIDDAEYASSYCIDLGGSLSLEPRAPFRYLNHCCSPNAQLTMQDVQYEDGTPAPPEIYVESLKPIAKGAEVTIDYQWSIDGAIPCLCGSDECRGWVVAIEELPKLPASKRRRSTGSRSTAGASDSKKASRSRKPR